MAQMKKLIIPSVVNDMEKTELSYTVGRNAKYCYFGKLTLYDPAI